MLAGIRFAFRLRPVVSNPLEAMPDRSAVAAIVPGGSVIPLFTAFPGVGDRFRRVQMADMLRPAGCTAPRSSASAVLILDPRKNVSMSAQALSVPPSGSSITIRRANPEDASVCGRVCFDAFYRISTNHGFPPDFPSPDVAVGLLSMMFSHPGFYCVVAESTGVWWAATVSMSDPRSWVSDR